MKLDPEEQEIEDAVERGEYVPVTGKELDEILESLAAFRKKNRMLTLRVNADSIDQIKEMARAKGVPYQSLISEMIHRMARNYVRAKKTGSSVKTK